MRPLFSWSFAVRFQYAEFSKVPKILNAPQKRSVKAFARKERNFRLRASQRDDEHSNAECENEHSRQNGNQNLSFHIFLLRQKAVLFQHCKYIIFEKILQVVFVYFFYKFSKFRQNFYTFMQYNE